MNTEPYIIKGIGGFYYVKTADGVVECRAKGIFRKRGITPVAGDRVRLEHEAGTAVIAEVLPRKNVFVRPPVANVDQFFIVASTVQPAPSTLVIDKLSAIAVDRGAPPVPQRPPASPSLFWLSPRAICRTPGRLCSATARRAFPCCA